jgi:hypothetical protein
MNVQYVMRREIILVMENNVQFVIYKIVKLANRLFNVQYAIQDIGQMKVYVRLNVLSQTVILAMPLELNAPFVPRDLFLSALAPACQSVQYQTVTLAMPLELHAPLV